MLLRSLDQALGFRVWFRAQRLRIWDVGFILGLATVVSVKHLGFRVRLKVQRLRIWDFGFDLRLGFYGFKGLGLQCSGCRMQR